MWFRGNDEVLLVPPTVLFGACHLIDRYLGPAAEAAFLDSAGIGDNNAFQLAGWLSSCDPRLTGIWAVPTLL